MLNASKIKHLSQQVVYQLSSREWIDASWNLAADGIAVDTTSVISTNAGIWRISCDSMRAVASIIDQGEIIQSLHQLNDIRPLPKVSRLVPIPPIGFGSVMAMLRSFPYQKMPDPIWCTFAWQVAVDPQTADSTELTSIKNGIWTIRCHSEHAWHFLQNPQPVLSMLRWLHSLKPLPQILEIRTVLGALNAVAPAPPPPLENLEDACLPDGIDDPQMRQLIARIQMARNQKKS